MSVTTAYRFARDQSLETLLLELGSIRCAGEAPSTTSLRSSALDVMGRRTGREAIRQLSPQLDTFLDNSAGLELHHPSANEWHVGVLTKLQCHAVARYPTRWQYPSAHCVAQHRLRRRIVRPADLATRRRTHGQLPRLRCGTHAERLLVGTRSRQTDKLVAPRLRRTSARPS